MLLADSFYHDTCQRRIVEPQKYKVSGGPRTEADNEGCLWGGCYPCDATEGTKLRIIRIVLFSPLARFLVWRGLHCFDLFCSPRCHLKR